MNYYIMTCPVGAKEKLADFKPDNLILSFKTGIRFSEYPPNPIELIWDAENETGARLCYYSSGKVLMTKKLVHALMSAGVDNLDTYSVVIKSDTGKVDCHDYLAVNIIGAISAVDRDKSEFIYDSGGLFDNIFETLVLNENKIPGRLLFRLAESISTIIVNEKVVAALKNRNDFGLKFVHTDDFAG